MDSANTIVVGSGGFDPIHPGHIQYIKAIEAIPAACHIIGLNSDRWLTDKKGRPFMDFFCRKQILWAVCQPKTIIYEMNDEAGNSCHFLEQLKEIYPTYKIIFAKGGDRNATNIPEMAVKGIEFVFDVGGGFDDKKYSSSNLISNYVNGWVERTWGAWRVLDSTQRNHQTISKVKILSIQPHQRLSMQKHNKRSEFWFAHEGDFGVNFKDQYGIIVKEGEGRTIGVGLWHQLYNPSETQICRILEIQYGVDCNEEDIEREKWN